MYPICRRTRADLPKRAQTVVALESNVGSVRRHRGAVAAKLIRVSNAAVAVHQKSFAVTSEKTPAVHHQLTPGGTDG